MQSKGCDSRVKLSPYLVFLALVQDYHYLLPLLHLNIVYKIQYHLLLFICYFSLRCWFCTIAIAAVVLLMFTACPSHTTLSFYYYSFLYYLRIPCPSPPKISGLLLLKLCKFLLTSTASPKFPCPFELLPLLDDRQVFKCFVIYVANIFLLHTWHCCSNYFLFGSEIIFYSMFLL